VWVYNSNVTERVYQHHIDRMDCFPFETKYIPKHYHLIPFMKPCQPHIPVLIGMFSVCFGPPVGTYTHTRSRVWGRTHVLPTSVVYLQKEVKQELFRILM
jgi:hypothetical protein